MGADAETVDRCPGGNQASDLVLVEVAAAEDPGLRQTTGIEDRTHAARHVAQVAAVDAHRLDPDAVPREFRRQRHHLACAGLAVVGVDQQHDVVGLAEGEIAKRRTLVAMRLHERVRHGAEHRDAEALPGAHRRRAGETCEVGGACGEQGGLGTVRTAHAEVDQLTIPGGQHAAHRLAGEQRLQVQQVDHPALDQLRLR